MTSEAKFELHDILIAAQIRLIGTVGPFNIIAEWLHSLHVEWGWV